MKGRLFLAVVLTFLVMGVLLSAIFWFVMWYFKVTGLMLIVSTAGLVGFMLFVQWLIGPEIIKSLSRMRECTDRAVVGMVNDLADASKIPRPKVYLVEDKTPNAFAFGRTQASSAIAIHTGLLDSLTKDEVRGVLAHEIGHIKHRDVLVMTLASALPAILYYIVYFGAIMASSRNRDGGGVNYLGAMLGGMVAQAIGTLLVLYLSRVREYYADDYSAHVTKSPGSLASALGKITYGLARTRAAPAPANLRMFYIADPKAAASEYAADMAREKKTGGLREIFMTHPLTYKRIAALKAVA